MRNYNERIGVAKKSNQKLMLPADEIEEIRQASRIVGGAVHPDTNEIILLPMRLSGFVWFNVPNLVLMSFLPN